MAIRKPIFVVPLDLGTVVCGNAHSGNPIYNLNRHLETGLIWKSEGNGNLWARGKFEATRSIDFCSMMAANALPGTTIRLRLGTTQAEVDGPAPYDSTALAFISPSITREDGLYHSHLEIGTVQNALWWRIDIGGHTGDFEASMLVLGKQIVPGRFYSYEFERGIEDLGDLNFNRWGVPEETPGTIMRTLAFTLGWMTEAEIEGSFQPIREKLGKRKPVFICFDPDPTTYRQSKTYIGPFRKAPFARGVKKPATYTMDFELLSVL